jgi:GWxTD domain-containing protein
MKPDLAYALLRPATRLVSTLSLLCLVSTLAAQAPSDQRPSKSVENEFNEEQGRRIAYANERFASGMPGWKTDRGRIYIKYGPPDEIESHPAASYQRPLEQGGGTTSTYPFEQWRYRYLEDIGADVVFEFVDSTNTGEYRLIVNPTDNDARANLRPTLPLYVPRSNEETLDASALILADLLERLPTKNRAAGSFTIGDTEIRPRWSATFANDEKLGFYIQLYHFALDPVSHKPNGSIHYQVAKNDSHQTVLDYTDEVSDLPGATSQVVVEKLLPLTSLAPGSYTLKLRVTDRSRNQTITPSADFTIIPSAPR